MTKSALIIEDHPIYRDALTMCLRAILGDENVSAVSSTEQGLTLVGNLENIGLILIDLGLPGMNGVEAINLLQRKCPEAAIVVVSASEDRREISAALRAGAKAFVSKAVSTQVISGVVQKILAAEPLESAWITVRGNQVAGQEQLLGLTPRQREALAFLCQGLSNKEIGQHLGLAEITVKIHVSSIFRALGVVNRTQAVLAARRFGLYSPEQDE
jgi:two-component system, NarL family, nitrate/nitrite response regulator NarL